MYHTQEKWENELIEPVRTTNLNAWLGDGYYFWYYNADADWWGNTAKKGTGHYQVYKADIDCENVFDTVFNEEHYNLWINVVEKAMQTFFKKYNGKITIKYINDFFKARGIFDDVDGVMFQDITNNKDYWVIDKFQYKKRIQIAIYNLPIITTFALDFEGKCV